METDATSEPTINSKKFFEELSTFRTIIQDKRNTLTQMDEAFNCLFLITSRVDPKDPRKELTEQAWLTTGEDFIRRKVLLMAAGHPI